ncbi:glycosyltransferase [Gallionella capsiferriformans]|uniref:Glycosyl transferase group 1 n=1 Tax=Gallionella capsiferriformans (strain ES-2) TaxID=395494 RepID=D9SFL3_GALCS|nr:glycosyltransferase [Gallionella capsiferriformans]ADL55310.1 glycosyl transferase group 1 [Gallionella capsiferriformans ES-2]
MKIVNWQPLFTDHQLYTWRALQALIIEPITHVVGTAASETRAKQGWKGADLSGLDVVYLDGKDWWQRGVAIIRANPEAVHVFCGYWAERRYFPLIVYALWHKAKVLIINESFSSESVGYLVEGGRLLNRIKATLRPLLYRTATVLLMLAARGSKPALLAISMRAVEQFKQAGLRNSQVFPFGYFIPPIPVAVQPSQISEQEVRLIFVGSLLPRKGLDVAIAAVTRCQEQSIPVTLAIYGAGDAAKYITDKTIGTTYLGKIPFGQAQAVIAKYDVLILPSRHDGWGVVVNEALLQGVPVIASENVGARCLVEASGAGAIFRNEDIAGLQKILQQLSADPNVLTLWRDNAATVRVLIEPEVAAKYMYDVLRFYFYQTGKRPKLLCFDH